MGMIKVLNGDIQVTKEEFQEEMENILRANDKMNSVTQTLVYKIIDLYETATLAKEAIIAEGAVVYQPQANGLSKLAQNPAVPIQAQAIAGMSKIIAQLELDKLVAEDDDDDI